VVVHGFTGWSVGENLQAGSVMAQAGVMLIGGDAGDALGDSLYEAVIYVAGKIASLGSDARIEELTESDVRAVKALAELGGGAFGHVQPENVTRVASARGLYNFDALKDQKY
jgi:methylamine---glutamate N-methyltransferase subunit B